MKTLTFVLTLALILGTTAASFAGNHPALTSPLGALVTSRDTVQMDEVTPWHKGALHSPTGVAASRAWYAYCPAAGQTNILNVKNQVEVKLSNGKRIMLCCKTCKEDVEKNLGKFSTFMY